VDRLRPLLVPLIVLLCFPAGAAAQVASEQTARELLYEAADAIDEAQDRIRAGSQLEADRLLTQAEQYLDKAERLDPNLTRVAYERSRLYHVDGQPDIAEGLLLQAMTEQLRISDHTQAVDLLDRIRRDLDKPSIGLEWSRARTSRDVGIGVLIGGAITSIIGYSIAFSSLSESTYARSEPDIAAQRAGLVLTAAGGGIALGGGIVTIGGASRVGKLEAVLPGPWRLDGARRKAARRR
jgi:hypothetical protein